MEDFDLHPARRVFHLDDECYVLYLGRDTDDYKPFLRVGTAHDLPAELRPLVYSVVVTDLLPGSPLLEQANVPPGYGEEFRYIGDPDTVERFKRYLHHTEVPTVGYDEAHEELEEQGAYAYFYDDGNLRLKFDKTEIFNLKRREDQDAHYTERARRVKKLFLKSRTKYATRVLNDAGFFISEGKPYLFSRGRIAALGTDESYFASLAASGIDPDRVAAVLVSEPDEGLVRLMKRIRGTAQLRILSDHPENVRPISELFAGDGKLSLKYEIARLTNEKFVQLLDFRIKLDGGGYGVERSDSSVLLHFGGGAGKAGKAPKKRGDGLTVDAAERRWSFSGAGASADGPVLEGTLYRLQEGDAPAVERLLSDYLPAATAGSRSDALDRAEDAAAAAISEFFRLASSGSDTQAAVRNVRSTLDSVDENISPLFWVYLENARSVATLQAARDEGRARSYQQFLSALLKPQKPPESVRLLPVVAELYAAEPSGRGAAAGDGMAVLYRLTETVTADSLGFAEELTDRYRETVAPTDPVVFEEERERLYDLLAGLDVVKARIPKRERTEEREREEAERQAREKSGQTAAQAERGAGRGDHGGESGRSRKSRRARRRRTVVGVAAALLILLLAGLGYLLLGPGGPGGPGGEPIAAADGDDAGEGGAAAGESGDGEGPAGEDDGDDVPGASEGDAGEDGDTAAPGSGIPGLEPRESVGGIVITILDIIEMANRIAGENGYRPMGAPEEAGPDPDWIFPGNVFTLPDGTTRTVVEGDTIWGIAADFIEKELAVRYERYLDIMTSYEDGDADRQEVIDQLVSLRDSTHAENFETLVQRSIEEVRAGE
ncbi:MAG: hypothetical protein R6W94_14905 [Spirochaetia bacterium]